MSSNSIINDDNFSGIPKPPLMGYYDRNKTNTSNSASTLQTILQKNCTNFNNSELLNSTDPDSYYNDALSTTVNEQCGNTIIAGSDPSSLNKDVTEACKSPDDIKKIVNQIRYLLCQLASSRNRTYDSKDFDILNNSMTVKDVFDKFSNIKIPMYFVFFLSLYFLIQGFFSSFDVSANMLSIIEKYSSKSLVYYVSLAFGIALPVLILSIMFVKKICGNFNEVEKYNITEDVNGKKESIQSGFKTLDYSILFLFIFMIYGFVFVLFSITKSSLGNNLYILLVGLIFFVISLFLYLFYMFIPFFATADFKNIDKNNISLKLFIDQQYDISNISSNQKQVENIQNVFIYTICFIFLLFFIYIAGATKIEGLEPNVKDIFSGLFGASAILIIPIIWVINFILATKYFYIYPIILLGFRFIRYLGMALLYTKYSYSQEYGINDLFSGDTFSEDLKEELENFGDYSPSYNLIGIDLIKTIMNLLGYENIFSKNYVKEPNYNLSSNKYVISGIFSYLNKSNDDTDSKNRLMIQGFITILTFVIGSILLFSVYKV